MIETCEPYAPEVVATAIIEIVTVAWSVTTRVIHFSRFRR